MSAPMGPTLAFRLEGAAAHLDALARRRAQTPAVALARALANQSFLARAEAEGGIVLLLDPDGGCRRVHLAPPRGETP